MAILSMTGFARIEDSAPAFSWVWEARSVNARGLDFRFSLPQGLDAIEAGIRKIAAERFARGNFSVTLRTRRADTAVRHRVDRRMLEEMMQLVADYRGDSAGEIRIESLLGVRGVVEPLPDDGDDGDAGERNARIVDGFVRLADALLDARREEGAQLQRIAAGLLDEISRLTAEASGIAPARLEERHAELRERLDELLSGDSQMPEERIAQEVALIVARGDVREELDRLEAHAEAARALVDDGGTVGRRLDFLCQELNREANTLCSKSSSLDLTRVGLDLKLAIERLREQVQNIE